MTKQETSMMITDAIRANNKELLAEIEKMIAKEDSKEKVYHYGTELPKWSQSDIKYVMDQKVFSGSAPNDLNINETQLKALCWIARAMKKLKK